MTSTTKCYRQRGFTLIEVMVALTVVAVTLPALLFLLSQQIDGTAYLRDRSVAQWVAADRVAEVQLAVAKQQRANKGVIAGESERAGQVWYWQSEIQETPLPGFAPRGSSSRPRRRWFGCSAPPSARSSGDSGSERPARPSTPCSSTAS